MSSPINIPAILIANTMGITILFVVVASNLWRLKEVCRRNRYLVIAFLACTLNCIIDPLCYIADGKPGTFNRGLVIGCNTLLYLCGMIIAYAWVNLLASHINVKLTIFHRVVLNVVLGAAALALIVNLFRPVFFTVDENNIYNRVTEGYIPYTVCYFGYMLDGLFLYVRERHESGGLKIFPAWAFVIPAAIGIAIQVCYYGVSTTTPFVTVSIVCIIICLQNEFMVRDKLTGLYNRFYLNTIDDEMKKSRKRVYTAIMLDMNGFKKINDTYGHKVGDEALIQLSSKLVEATGNIGEVVRYAGDEFIIILNTQEDAKAEEVIAQIHELLDSFNREKKHPYELSVATGYCRLDLNKNTLDEFMDMIDKLMYEDKKEYYQFNIKYDRRKSDKKPV